MLEGVEESDLAARIASACAETAVQAEGDAELAAAYIKSGDEDDELAVLPRHTKVIVTGNHRTKSVLVGLEGVVKKAVGLGGWHWLVLTNGAEVKLQRNALSVLEAPTGLEEDDDDLEDLASNDTNLVELGKPLRLRARVQKHSVLRAGNRNSTRMLTSDTSRLLRVDFSKFEMSSLLRYWRHFKLVELGPNPSKEQLVSAVERHFMSLVRTSSDTIWFVWELGSGKRHTTKLYAYTQEVLAIFSSGKKAIFWYSSPQAGDTQLHGLLHWRL